MYKNFQILSCLNGTFIKNHTNLVENLNISTYQIILHIQDTFHEVLVASSVVELWTSMQEVVGSNPR